MDYTIKRTMLDSFKYNLTVEVPADLDIDFINYFMNNIPEKVSIRYQSKYNSYVVYDYEPFCIEGFYRQYIIIIDDIRISNYYEYLLNKNLKQISDLEKLYNQKTGLQEA